MVIKLLPTSGGAHPAPVEVMVPSSVQSMAEVHQRISDAVYKSRQAGAGWVMGYDSVFIASLTSIII